MLLLIAEFLVEDKRWYLINELARERRTRINERGSGNAGNTWAGGVWGLWEMLTLVSLSDCKCHHSELPGDGAEAKHPLWVLGDGDQGQEIQHLEHDSTRDHLWIRYSGIVLKKPPPEMVLLINTCWIVQSQILIRKQQHTSKLQGMIAGEFTSNYREVMNNVPQFRGRREGNLTKSTLRANTKKPLQQIIIKTCCKCDDNCYRVRRCMRQMKTKKSQQALRHPNEPWIPVECRTEEGLELPGKAQAQGVTVRARLSPRPAPR